MGRSGAFHADPCLCPDPGIIVQGTGSSNTYVASFSFQFGSDGLHWHNYGDNLPGSLHLPKVPNT
jgi:hypothetical protein